MRRAGVLALILSASLAVPVEAQPEAPPQQMRSAEANEPPAQLDPVLAVGTSEWMIAGGPAFGVQVFHSAMGYGYFLQTVSWGRILTGPHGPGLLRGRFEWAVEVVPFFGQHAPDTTFGIGATPLTWRWNFEPRGRLAPFAELAGGALWTRDPVPRGTTTINFTAHIGYAIRYFFRPHHALVVGYRFHHISNGNRLESNPGVNAHMLQLGLSLMRPRARRAGRR